jgi:serine phosphatase RsbU (regulator of sigma subunit)
VLETVQPDGEFDAATRSDLETLAAVVAAEVVTRGQYGDIFVRSRRREGMGIAAEVIWQLLPPHTFATSEVSIAGALEPAYEVGGDVFDFAFNTPTLHLAMLDAVGHGLASSLVATLAVTGYRNARRTGASLTETYGRVDRLLADHSKEITFVTGHLAELDAISGELRWINAGHPPPLLVRQGHVVRTLDSRPRPPLGLGSPRSGPVKVATERLEPGDSVLFYTDGVIEARTPAGIDFGMERLTDFLERAASTGMAPPEVVRRLSHAVVDHHQGILRDDAATMLVQWHPSARP